MRKYTLLFLLAFVTFVPTFAQNEIPDSVEYAALKALYDSTNGAGWNNNTNWLTGTTSADFATWHGVTVANGDIVQLNLYGNNLIGSIPPQIESLGKLVKIGLYQNSLAGSLPPLNGLTNLYFLDLSNNQYTGTIPSGWGSLSGLKVLKVRNNELGGEIPDSLRNLTLLEDFRLAGNNLIGEIPDWLDSLPSLIYLYLENNFLNGSLPQQWQLSSIQYLNLSNNNFNEGAIPAWVFASPDVKLIWLGNCHLTGNIPHSNTSLNSLYALNLENNKLTGEIPDWIGNCSALTNLNLNRNNLQGNIPSTFRNLSLITNLDLSGNNLTGHIPDFLSDLPLKNLYLFNNQLTGSIPESFGESNSLVFIRLENNQLSGSIPEAIGNCSTLERLYVSNNNLTGNISQTLNQAPKLKILTLSDNEFSSIGDFTQHPNAVNLQLIVENNRLPWFEIAKLLEPDGSYIFSNFIYDNQTPDQAPPQVEYYQNQDTLRLVAGPDDPEVSYQWQVDSAGSWENLAGETSYELIILDPPSTLLRYRALINTTKLAGTNVSRTYEVRSGEGSPNSSPLEAYFPVDLSTGTMTMSLPLATVSSRSLSHSVSLHYAASGVKVTQPGGLYGVNWSLSGGGSIRRELRGLPDELDETTTPYRKGWLVNGNANLASQFNPVSYTEDNQYSYLNNGFTNDTEPDIFHVNLPGYSGYFVFDQNGNPRFQPMADIKVEVFKEFSNTYTSMILTDESGIKYHLDFRTTTDMHAEDIPFYAFTNDRALKSSADPYRKKLRFASGWFMTKMVHPDGSTMAFEYEKVYPKESTPGGLGASYEFKKGNDYESAYLPNYIITHNTQDARLEKITGVNEEIRLQYEDAHEYFREYLEELQQNTLLLQIAPAFYKESRLLFYGGNSLHLTQVEKVYRSPVNGRVFTDQFRLSYKYTPLLADEGQDHIEFKDIRWFLEEVEHKKGDIVFGDYRFSYNFDQPIPARAGRANDLWGYIGYTYPESAQPKTWVYQHTNGRLESTHFPYADTTNLLFVRDGASMATRPGHIVTGTLTNVSFPTGATATFTYEPHESVRADREDVYTGGGIRISAMRFHDGLSKANDVLKYFDYRMDNDTTSGKMIYEPKYTFFTPAPVSRYFEPFDLETERLAYLSSDSIGILQNTDFEQLVRRSLVNMAWSVPLPGDGTSPAVRYSQVTVRKPGEGSMRYHFDVPVYVGKYDHPDYERAATYFVREAGVQRDTTYLYGRDVHDIYPFAPSVNISDKQSRLLKEELFSEDGDLAAKTEYTYQTLSAGGANGNGYTVYGVLYDQWQTALGNLFAVGKYGIRTGVSYAPDSVVSYVYDSDNYADSTRSVVQSTYREGGYPYLVSRKATDEAGVTTISHITYTDDLNTNGLSGDYVAALDRLEETHRKGVVAESYTEKSLNGNTLVVQAAYKELSLLPQADSSLVVADAAYALPAGDGLADFQPLHTSATLSPDARYIEVNRVKSYQPYGIPKEMTDRSRSEAASLWGYDYTMPVAQVVHGPVSSVLYSQFPRPSEQAWTSDISTYDADYATRDHLAIDTDPVDISGTVATYSFTEWLLTGMASADGTAVLDITVTDGTSQVTETVTIPASDPEAYFEQALTLTGMGDTLSVTVARSSGTSSAFKLYELSFRPADVALSSIVYDDGYGVKRQTDERGRYTTTEYDRAGRPVVVKDDRGNIRQKYDYQKSRAREELEVWLTRLDDGSGSYYQVAAEIPFDGLYDIDWFYYTPADLTLREFTSSEASYSADSLQIDILKDCRKFTLVCKVTSDLGEEVSETYAFIETPTFLFTGIYGDENPGVDQQEVYTASQDGVFCGTPDFKWVKISADRIQIDTLATNDSTITVNSGSDDFYLQYTVSDASTSITGELFVDVGVPVLEIERDISGIYGGDWPYTDEAKPIRVNTSGGLGPYKYVWYYKPSNKLYYEYDTIGITVDTAQFIYTHPYNNCNEIDVAVVATDSLGQQDSIYFQLPLLDPVSPPLTDDFLNFSYSPDKTDGNQYPTGYDNETVTFTAYPGGMRGSPTYVWERYDYDTSTWTEVSSGTASSITQTRSTSYKIRVTVSDECGLFRTRSVYIPVDTDNSPE